MQLCRQAQPHTRTHTAGVIDTCLAQQSCLKDCTGSRRIILCNTQRATGCHKACTLPAPPHAKRHANRRAPPHDVHVQACWRCACLLQMVRTCLIHVHWQVLSAVVNEGVEQQEHWALIVLSHLQHIRTAHNTSHVNVHPGGSRTVSRKNIRHSRNSREHRRIRFRLGVSAEQHCHMRSLQKKSRMSPSALPCVMLVLVCGYISHQGIYVYMLGVALCGPVPGKGKHTCLCTAMCLSCSCVPVQYQPTMSCFGNTVLSAHSARGGSSGGIRT